MSFSNKTGLRHTDQYGYIGGMGKKGDDTRKRILDAAQQLILSHGYSGMSLDQLIRQLGMTKGAFFHHFENKHDLARTLIQRYSDDGVTLFKTALARANTGPTVAGQDPLPACNAYDRLYRRLAPHPEPVAVKRNRAPRSPYAPHHVPAAPFPCSEPEYPSHETGPFLTRYPSFQLSMALT